MAIRISRNFDIALRMLGENPAIFIPSLASLLVTTSVIALSLGLFFYVTGAPAASFYEAALSSLPFFFLVAVVDFFLVLVVSAYFDSISLYMVRQAWRAGSVDTDDSFSRGGMYAVSLVSVDLFFSALVLLFGAGALVPLFSESAALLPVSLVSFFFLAASFLLFYWRKEAVVLKGRASVALSFSQDFFSRNVWGTVRIAAFVFLIGFTIEFFGDSVSEVFVYLLGSLNVPEFFGSAAALAVAFLSALLYGVVSRVLKLCVFLDSNR